MFAFYNIVTFAALVVAVLVAIAFTVYRAKRTDGTSLVLKSFASICFVLLGLSAAAASGAHAYAFTALAGLVFGLLGDVFLDVKFICPQYNNKFTFAGFASFALGHIFYCLFIIAVLGAKSIAFIIAGACAVLGGLFIHILSPKAMKLNYGIFRMTSACYAALLGFTAVLAIVTCITGGGGVLRILFALAMVLFALSDVVLCKTYFGGKTSPAYKVVNHLLYYAAQIIIAFSLIFLQ